MIDAAPFTYTRVSRGELQQTNLIHATFIEHWPAHLQSVYQICLSCATVCCYRSTKNCYERGRRPSELIRAHPFSVSQEPIDQLW